MVDTLGLLLNVVVHAANLQDRDGLRQLLDRRTRDLFPFIQVIFADGGSQGDKAAKAVQQTGTWRLDIVRPPEGSKGFVVLPKRWIVERTLAWISRCRRLAKDFEALVTTAVALIRLAMIKLMVRRLARHAQ